MKGRLGAAMDPHLKALNPQKMTKVDEAAKEVKPSKYDRPENWKPFMHLTSTEAGYS